MVEQEYNHEMKSKSDYTPEELFDRLVSLSPTSVEGGVVALSKRKARGLGKNALRAVGVSDEGVSRLLPTQQARIIKKEIGGLPGSQQAEFMQRLCELERERIFIAVKEAVAELDNENLVAVQSIGSINAIDRWPNDLDVNLIMTEVDKELARAFRVLVQEKIVKKVDVKNVFTVDDFDLGGANNLIDV